MAFADVFTYRKHQARDALARMSQLHLETRKIVTASRRSICEFMEALARANDLLRGDRVGRSDAAEPLASSRRPS